MKTVDVSVKSSPSASRIELFVRFVWWIPVIVVLFLFGILAGICLVILWFCILITGKRNDGLVDVIRKYFFYVTKIHAYFNLLTDERCPILPEN